MRAMFAAVDGILRQNPEVGALQSDDLSGRSKATSVSFSAAT